MRSRATSEATGGDSTIMVNAATRGDSGTLVNAATADDSSTMVGAATVGGSKEMLGATKGGASSTTVDAAVGGSRTIAIFVTGSGTTITGTTVVAACICQKYVTSVSNCVSWTGFGTKLTRSVQLTPRIIYESGSAKNTALSASPMSISACHLGHFVAILKTQVSEKHGPPLPSVSPHRIDFPVVHFTQFDIYRMAHWTVTRRSARAVHERVLRVRLGGGRQHAIPRSSGHLLH